MKSRSRRDSADRSLKHWRERLLDLSRRNPLLYFNGSRGTKIRIARPGLEEVYDAIVVREKALTLPKPRPVNSDLEPPMLSRTAVDEQVDEQVVAEIPGDLSIDYSVGSARDVAELQRKLRRLWKNARASLEELGVNTLYLALGAVEWREAEQADSYDRAPLILVPAKLDPKDGDAFRLSCFERDARLNPVLDFKLRATYGVTLPSFDAYSGLDGGDPRPQEWLERVREVVGALDWRVRDEVWLSHFSFEKLVMYEDLGLPGTPEAVRGHPVLGALVQVREYEAKPVPSELSPPGAEAFDRPDLFPVVDADSSQLEVLAAVASGNSLTVEGPPGTGKSQTIVNIIAQALRKGKTVLFVSEKRAALEVVYRRLEQRGLDRFCLELHSHRTQRASLVSQLHAELDRVDESPDTVDEGEFEYRTALRRRLDEYVRELHEPRGESRLTAFQVQGQLAKLSATPDVDAPLPLSAIDISPAQEREMREALRAITATSVWDRERDHPWRDAKPEGPEFVVGRNLDRTLEEFGVAIRALDDIGRRLRRSPCGSLKLGRVKDLPAVLTVLRALGEPPPAVVAVGGRIATDTMTAAREHVCSGLLVAGSDGKILSRYAKRYHRWWWRLTPMYVHDKLTIARAVGRRVRWQDALLLLTAATKYRKVFKQMAGIMGAPPGGRPDRLRGKSGDAGSIAVATAVLLGRLFEEGIRLPDDLARNLLRDPLAVHKIASQFSRELASVSNQLHRALPPIQGLFPSGIGGRAIPEIALGDLLGRIQSCREHLDLLDEWRNYVRALDRAGEIGLGPFLERGRAVGVSNLELEEAFVKRLRRRWLEEVYEQSSLLRDFDLRNHERVIEQFRFIDRSLVDKASILVERAVYDRREPVRTATGFASVRGRPGANRPDRMELIQRLKIQIRLLQREARKKQRHLPIRRLLPDIAELALLLKPCFLMSPLSVATYLPRDRFRFDVIIFDEASQVLPEDAVGTILRGEEVVIFGDSKQLPPTPFFRRLIDEDEDVGEREEETDTDSVAGFESILDLARTALPAKALRWHYRSRDERLISFSNHRFYSDRPLITFPSPRLSTDSTGVRLLVCEEGRWEPNLRRNLPEARLVVDLVMEHLERRPERSLGVIALGLGQAEAIDLELERRLSERPDLAAKRETFADEPLFVKNLENVQGDERDEIILSIGYGPEEPGGRVPMRFGPINQSGGERRLNVAVTRARYRTTVVASFEPQALLRAAELRPGPRYLHEYLVYAQREGRAMATPDANGSGRPESEFEEAVKSALEARGYLVDAQVGQSGYRIDLAVRDPEHPERYILAIECDGASYHSAPAIRDRDRLRQEQLESLGWQFHRIWSTDWIRDPDRALQRVIEAIERARRESPDDRAKGGG